MRCDAHAFSFVAFFLCVCVVGVVVRMRYGGACRSVTCPSEPVSPFSVPYLSRGWLRSWRSPIHKILS